MENPRALVIPAHPDGADLLSGVTSMRLTRSGARVRYLSVCNGDKGHQTAWGAPLAARRRKEAEASARLIGVEKYTVLDYPDCELEVMMELKRELTRLIREFAPHFVFTHRVCDYHSDHRAVATALMDITYFLGVPGWCPEAAVPSVRPAVLFLRDTFTVPRELRADIIVPARDPELLARYYEALSCHVSQFAEWLPFDRNIETERPDWNDIPARNAFLEKNWVKVRKGYDAQRFGVPELQYVEAFEISEYGRPPSRDELIDVFGSDAVLRDRQWMQSR